MKNFLRSAVKMSCGTVLSRVSGFIRDIFIAKYLGTSAFSDVFFLAFRIPNFFRKIFAEGAVNSAFTPIFASGVQVHGKQKMMTFARNIFSILLYSLFIFTIFIEIIMPYLMCLLAPGYIDKIEQFNLIVSLTRITFPYLIFISLVSLISGILNTFNRFFVVSISPVLLNLTIIIATIIFRNYLPKQLITFMSYSIVVAGIVQLIWIIVFSIRDKIYIFPTFPKLTPSAKEFFSKFFSAFLASGITQINSMIDSTIATLIPNAVSLLYYADRIYQFPLSLIGTTIGITILPTLARKLSKKGNKEEAQELQEDAIFISCLLGIPSGIGIFVLSNIVIKILFQRGEFTAENTIQVANILKIYSLALPFFIISKILQTIFYAKKDTKTPMKNSIYCLIINTVISFSLVFIIGANGIAIGTTISAIFTTFSLLHKLIKDKIFILSDELLIKLLKIIYSSIIMGVVVYSINKYLINISIFDMLKLIISISCGGIVFLLLSLLLNIINIRELLLYFKKEE